MNGDLLQLIREQGVALRLEVNGEDLAKFGEQLINQTWEAALKEKKEQSTEAYLPKEEVMKMCGVCHATLWHWANKGYLKPIKLGHKVFYRKSDLEQILKGK